ncbi:MAG TPA: hypothetical protein VGI85_11630 [Chthoniobacterales bacterium]|jgi:hypothetical protein
MNQENGMVCEELYEAGLGNGQDQAGTMREEASTSPLLWQTDLRCTR